MTLPDLWQNLPPEARDFLLGLAGKSAEGLVKKVAAALGTPLRGTPEQALRDCLTAAVAVFLACLDLPEDPALRAKDWGHIEDLLLGEAVQEALIQAVLHEGAPKTVDPVPFRQALDETNLPWRVEFPFCGNWPRRCRACSD